MKLPTLREPLCVCGSASDLLQAKNPSQILFPPSAAEV